ncbi:MULTISPECIES: hypothetical protein [Noviherbaspirillum]|jgi:hypothetical protein|uniref:Uncharacterized protein n=1 Tax=Noviherbaspirillum album TaxID=3080276 RepID=A0ABU6JGV0_9BURK|nr:MULTISPECIES: hypothetical protein [Noviherbaspirillum]MEC4722889.1 hypothetical protein [Noviherbaspirillum sp. CPCC 100848]
MSSKQWLAVAAWVCVPLAASAQQQTQPNPLDANAPTAAVSYESAFKNFRASNDEGTTPDKLWRSANDEMGKIGGHAGHMKDAGSTPVAPANANTPAPQQGGAVDHSKHH